jgi:hypothetical protein
MPVMICVRLAKDYIVSFINAMKWSFVSASRPRLTISAPYDVLRNIIRALKKFSAF